MIKCNKCGVIKYKDGYYRRDNRIRQPCKFCMKKYERNRYQIIKEAKKAYAKLYYKMTKKS